MTIDRPPEEGERHMPDSAPRKLEVIRAYLEEEFPGYVFSHAEEAETGIHIITLKNHKTYHIAIADDFLAERDVETIQNDLAIGRVADRVREAANGRILLSSDGIAVERVEIG